MTDESLRQQIDVYLDDAVVAIERESWPAVIFQRPGTAAKAWRGSAMRTRASGSPSSRRTMFVPWTSDTHS